jgi:hypothetical protein
LPVILARRRRRAGRRVRRGTIRVPANGSVRRVSRTSRRRTIKRAAPGWRRPPLVARRRISVAGATSGPAPAATRSPSRRVRRPPPATRFRFPAVGAINGPARAAMSLWPRLLRPPRVAARPRLLARAVDSAIPAATAEEVGRRWRPPPARRSSTPPPGPRRSRRAQITAAGRMTVDPDDALPTASKRNPFQASPATVT